MNLDALFSVCNYGVLPAWLLLACAPRWSWTEKIVHRIWIPMLLGVAYTTVVVLSPGSPEGGSFGSLKGVMILFTSPHAALAGWIHYLVFDLFIGAWELRDSQRRGIHHAFMLPCLFFTLMLGPAGLLGYLCLRTILTRETRLTETEPVLVPAS